MYMQNETRNVGVIGKYAQIFIYMYHKSFSRKYDVRIS